MSDTGIGHDVSPEIPIGIGVGKRGRKIRVWSDGIRFGTLTISKGAIEAKADSRAGLNEGR